MIHCWNSQPYERPEFTEVQSSLEEIRRLLCGQPASLNNGEQVIGVGSR
jgi:hypothetical protein